MVEFGNGVTVKYAVVEEVEVKCEGSIPDGELRALKPLLAA